MRTVSFKKIVVSLIVFAFVAVFGVRASQAQATVSNTRFDFPINNGSLFDQCTGDNVTFNGTLHLMIHQVSHPDGDAFFSLRLDYQDVVGVGDPSGNTYRIQNSSHSIQDLRVTGPFEEIVTNDGHVISEGSSPNEMMRFTLHLVINANGQVQVDVQKVENVCN
jgi:hypothetical protein